MSADLHVPAAGERLEHGVWSMPDEPHAVRAVITVLLTHPFGEHHVCIWPDDIKPAGAVDVGHCNCGGTVDLARQVVAALGRDGEPEVKKATKATKETT